ncbi:MAG: histidine phosphatase family protein [Myxococcales bacterium]|nr:histidine phosphatase family protein [Myxococcales bacterium]
MCYEAVIGGTAKLSAEVCKFKLCPEWVGSQKTMYICWLGGLADLQEVHYFLLMRRLALMRHGKSAWNTAVLTDFSRRLAPRGIRSTLAVGTALENRHWRPDRVLCSDARRAVETAEYLEQLWPGLPVQQAPELYLGSIYHLAQVMSRCSSSLKKVLVIGHSPGLDECVKQLTGKSISLKTADVVILETPLSDWHALARMESGGFRLVDHIVARLET